MRRRCQQIHARLSALFESSHNLKTHKHDDIELQLVFPSRSLMLAQALKLAIAFICSVGSVRIGIKAYWCIDTEERKGDELEADKREEFGRSEKPKPKPKEGGAIQVAC